MLLKVLGALLLVQPQASLLQGELSNSRIGGQFQQAQNIYINPDIIKKKPTINPILLRQLEQTREAVEVEVIEESDGHLDEDDDTAVEIEGTESEDLIEIKGTDESDDSEEDLSEPINDDMEIDDGQAEDGPQECKGETFGERLACSLLDSLKESLIK